eukprot:CAMPEP_0119551260 /NCGR_PEP_ID=MMETSP1352-20130426/4554_1 /TAXON_ID=265584 /ORGANISM="Stauroneis constricta, Strain CCMP1120" /LENGTH=269 /DNA_ID=CAMNT_0007597281 /DNA_START=274 /DNA_END=1083 /DNA_ORIENTATION=+
MPPSHEISSPESTFYQIESVVDHHPHHRECSDMMMIAACKSPASVATTSLLRPHEHDIEEGDGIDQNEEPSATIAATATTTALPQHHHYHQPRKQPSKASQQQNSNNNSNTKRRHTRGRKKTAQQRRRVRFNPDVEVRDTIHVNDITDNEYFDYWLCDADYQLITEMAEITVELIELGEAEDLDAQLCFRGLREKTRHEEHEYRLRHHHIVSLVLDEQDFQVSRMIYDPEYIAQLYKQHSKDSAMRARFRGEKDRFEAYHSRTNLYDCV